MPNDGKSSHCLCELKMSNSLMKPHFSFKYERLFLLILFIPNLFIMSFPCVFCKQSVRPKQHALECESCFQCTGYAVQVCLCFIQFLSHLCETLIEIGRYRKLPREDRLCLYCENKIDDEYHFFSQNEYSRSRKCIKSQV